MTDKTAELAAAAEATLRGMLDSRRKQLASCERMLELLQPEWDKFEARTGHDIYVARDYADHTSAARTHRKEIAALEFALDRPNPAVPADGLREALVEVEKIALSHSNYGHVEGNRRAFAITRDVRQRIEAIDRAAIRGAD